MRKHKLLALCAVVLLLLALAGTAYAAEETYTITYHGTGGTNVPAAQEKVKGESITLSDMIPVREGYTFLGWAEWNTGRPNYQPGDTYSFNHNLNLYAAWESKLSISLGQTIEVTLPASGIVQYHFTPEADGWYGLSYEGDPEYYYGCILSTDANYDLYYEMAGMEGCLMEAGQRYTFEIEGPMVDTVVKLTMQTMEGPTGLELTLNDAPTGDTAWLYEGYDVYLDAHWLPEGYYGGRTSYTHSDDTVAELKKGYYSNSLKALTPGTTVVTVTNSGFSDSCTVTVKEIPVQSISAELRTVLYEKLDGHEGWEEGSFTYDIPETYLYITVNYKDGTSEVFNYADLEESDYPAEVEDPPYDETWEVGTHYLEVTYLGVSCQCPVEVVPVTKQDLPATETKNGELSWERLGGEDLFFTKLTAEENNQDVRILAGYDQDENWHYNYKLAVTRNDRDFTVMALDDVLAQVGIQAEPGYASVNRLTNLKDDIFISVTWQDGSALLRTTDGVNFTRVSFPYNKMEIDEMVEAEYYPSKSIFLAGDTYVVMCSQYHYYTSPDLVNWTRRDFPTYDWQYENSAVPTFSVAAATEKGLYLLAGYNFGPTMDYAEEGIFFTSDFVSYKCITEDFPKGTIYYTQPMESNLRGDRIAIVSVLGDYLTTYSGYHNIRLDIYDENTGEMRAIVNEDGFISDFNFNLGGYDPVQLIVKDRGQSISWFISSRDKEIISSHQLPMDAAKWKASIKTRWLSKDGRYYADVALYGDTLYISGDYYETAVVIKLPENIASDNITKLSANSDEDLLVLEGAHLYACPLSAVEALLQPMTELAGDSGVTVTPASPDALPEDSRLVAEVVGQDAQTITYEINIHQGEATVQPEFPVYVRLPLPVKGDGITYKVYRVENDGSRTDMNAFVDEGYLYFVTDHFSRYELKVTGGRINPFTDVKADRFEEAILWAYYGGITTGTGDGTTFSPENACTRKQIVTFLWRAAGEPEPKSMVNPFTDVKADRFEKAILWAYYEGITSGTGDGTTFSPENTCTRKQIVTFLWRYNGQPAPKNMDNKFVDVKNDRFTAAILWAAEQGITTGTGDGTTFSPENACTRKQIVTFLFRNLSIEK